MLHVKHAVKVDKFSKVAIVLVKCISKRSERNNFDDIRFETYHQKSFHLDSKKLPPTSSSIHIHIKRAFLQCYLWLHVPFVESVEINSEDYEY